MVRKPSPLRAGQTVALAAPAGVCDRERLRLGTDLLERWGLVVRGLPELEPHRYFAAKDQARAGHLAGLFADREISAILCVRGGYGCSRLVEGFELRESPPAAKIFVGFSDVSILLNRLVREGAMACYHGPMIAADLPRLPHDAQERFRRFLFGEPDWWDGRVSEVWRGGHGSGPLAGGCLSLLVTTLGTPYEVDTRGTVLFLEDVAEKPYRIDRMLTHLRHAGKLAGLAALVFGRMLDCDDGRGPAALRDIVMEATHGSDYPIVFGLDAGHGSHNVVLPFGCRVRVDSAAGAVELLEPALAGA